jgi:hypothetical protein
MVMSLSENVIRRLKTPLGTAGSEYVPTGFPPLSLISLMRRVPM